MKIVAPHKPWNIGFLAQTRGQHREQSEALQESAFHTLKASCCRKIGPKL